MSKDCRRIRSAPPERWPRARRPTSIRTGWRSCATGLFRRPLRPIDEGQSEDELIAARRHGAAQDLDPLLDTEQRRSVRRRPGEREADLSRLVDLAHADS